MVSIRVVRVFANIFSLVCIYSKVGFTCIRIYLRSDHIMEIEAGTHLTKNKDDACYDHHFSSFLTLTSKWIH